MKPTECPARKKIRRKKGKKRGGGKAMTLWEAFEMFEDGIYDQIE